MDGQEERGEAGDFKVVVNADWGTSDDDDDTDDGADDGDEEGVAEDIKLEIDVAGAPLHCTDSLSTQGEFTLFFKYWSRSSLFSQSYT